MKDSRRQQHGILRSKKKSAIIQWLKSKQVESIAALNACKLSLGVIHLNVNQWEGYALEREEKSPPVHHASLFEDIEDQAVAEPQVAKVRFAPYIRFEDAVGEHKLQIREWGAYRLLSQDKYIDTPDALWGAPAYMRGKDLWIVVGNMTNHRSNCMVIKTFQSDEVERPSLFDAVFTEDE